MSERRLFKEVESSELAAGREREERAVGARTIGICRWNWLLTDNISQPTLKYEQAHKTRKYLKAYKFSHIFHILEESRATLQNYPMFLKGF